MTHTKYLKFLFFEDNDFILVKSAAQILSLNLEYTFLLLNVLVTDHIYSSASCSFTFIRILFFYEKTYRPYLLILFVIYHSHDF